MKAKGKKKNPTKKRLRTSRTNGKQSEIIELMSNVSMITSHINDLEKV